MNAKDLARRIEHAVLNPQATEDDVAAGVRLAAQLGVRALVVKPCYVAAAAHGLARTPVKVVTVVGFPHGGQTTETKRYEAHQACAQGADEVDLVINIGALREGRFADVFNEIRTIVAAVEGRPVKVIVEAAYLNDQEKRMACRLAARAGAAYVKTSAGFAPTGATVADVVLMRRTLGKRLGIKAAGGIRSYADAAALIEAGADLVGTSHTEAILTEVAHRAA